MKKDYFVLGLIVALVLLAMMACSSDDDSAKNLLKPGDDVYFQYIEADVPYSPLCLVRCDIILHQHFFIIYV